MTRRGILWDLDGTLVDSEPAHRASFAQAAASLGFELPDNFEQRVLGTNERDVYEMLQAESGLKLSFLDWRALKWQCFERNTKMIRLRSETQVTLSQAAQLKLHMAIVTNSTTDELELNLRATDMPPVFLTKISGQDVSQPKPNPEGYLKAAAHINKKASDCIVIEDSLPGTLAGLAGGMTTILFPQHETPKDQVPKGAHYLSPQEDLWKFLQQFL